MIVSCHHVLGAEVDERQEIDAGDFLNVALVAFCNGMRDSRAAEKWHCQNCQKYGKSKPPAQNMRAQQPLVEGSLHEISNRHL